MREASQLTVTEPHVSRCSRLRTREARAMTMTLRQIPTEAGELATFKQAMRHLIGGVSVITAGADEARTGLTVTSAISLSLDPPTMLVCVNRNASAWPVIQRERHYCVNILDSRHQHVADRFAGRGGVKGAPVRRRAMASIRHRRLGPRGRARRRRLRRRGNHRTPQPRDHDRRCQMGSPWRRRRGVGLWPRKL